MSLKCEIFVERSTTNQLNADKLQNQYQEIVHCLKNRPSAGTTKAKATPVNTINCEGGGYRYGFVVTLTVEPKRSETAAIRMLEKAKLLVIRAAMNRSWSAKDLAESRESKQVAEERGPLVVGELSKEILQKYFGDVYEREAHLRVINRNSQIYVGTKGRERCHTLLYGLPASAKTILFKGLKSWYEAGDDTERVAIVSATSISKSGLENWILEKARDGVLPEILCFDEIEKYDMDNLYCLWALMDGAGVIRKLNARVGRVEAKANSMIWATANSIEKIKGFADGSLFSRFTHTLCCKRPSRDLMHKILLDKLNERKVDGLVIKEEWAKAALDLGYDVLKTDDPRKIIGLLAGGDDLLNGCYISDLTAAGALE